MIVREVRLDEKEAYNILVSHPVQSWEWGEFKRKTGAHVIRLGIFDGKRMTAAYQLTFHSLPKVPYSVGYFPKGPLPDERMLNALQKIAGEQQAIFIKLEPNVLKGEVGDALTSLSNNFFLQPGKTVFTPYNFNLDLARSEEELLAAMKPKTRYNLRLAERRGVKVVEDNSNEAFEKYLRLTFETAKRQGFYAHDEDYHRKMWGTLHPAGVARLLTASWRDQILVAWIVFVFKEAIYYPYGASSNEHRNLMASNLMMWEVMRFGKRLGCQSFDMWGSLGPDPDPKDPWYGFHRFKEGYGGKLVEFVGSYDFVLYPQLYALFRIVDDLRWKWLRFISRFR